MSRMEDDAAIFLKKIARSLSAGLLWMLLNTILGIYFGWMFFKGAPTLGNYIFYAFMALSLAALLRYLYKIWKEHFKH